MDTFSPAVERLIEQFAHLPGVGKKSAMRMAFAVLGMRDQEAQAFAAAITEAKRVIHRCPECCDLTEEELCHVCASATRDHGIICVVSDPKDAAAVERTHEYKGVYHVLHGVINPMARKGPEDVTIRELMERVQKGGVREIILATDPDAAGETTAMYIARLLREYPVKITRLAYGMAMGSHLEFTDQLTLNKALSDRKDF